MNILSRSRGWPLDLRSTESGPVAHLIHEAVTKITDDVDVLLAFYDYAVQHWDPDQQKASTISKQNPSTGIDNSSPSGRDALSEYKSFNTSTSHLGASPPCSQRPGQVIIVPSEGCPAGGFGRANLSESRSAGTLRPIRDTSKDKDRHNGHRSGRLEAVSRPANTGPGSSCRGL